MNERIKNLAEQAGFHFYDMHNVDGQDLGETIEADSWTAAEEFTRLVVLDCVQYLINEIDRLEKYKADLEKLEEQDHLKEIFIDNVDVCIDKCRDNIQGLLEHYGITQ